MHNNDIFLLIEYAYLIRKCSLSFWFIKLTTYLYCFGKTWKNVAYGTENLKNLKFLNFLYPLFFLTDHYLTWIAWCFYKNRLLKGSSWNDTDEMKYVEYYSKWSTKTMPLGSRQLHVMLENAHLSYISSSLKSSMLW